MIDTAKELAEAQATVASLKSDVHAILGLLEGLGKDYSKRGDVITSMGIGLVVEIMTKKLERIK